MSIDPRFFRQTVGQFVTGVTVIAMEVDGSIRALTANSFTSLSLNPPLVLFCLGKGTKAGQLIHQVAEFSVNILSQEQQPLSSYFAGAWKEETPPPFSFTRSEGGPRLDGSVAALGCHGRTRCTKAAITGSSSARWSRFIAASCRAHRSCSSAGATPRSPRRAVIIGRSRPADRVDGAGEVSRLVRWCRGAMVRRCSATVRRCGCEGPERLTVDRRLGTED